jgi:hypothetical protein
MSLFNLACEVITDYMSDKEIVATIYKYPCVIDMRTPPIYRTLDEIILEQRREKQIEKKLKTSIII